MRLSLSATTQTEFDNQDLAAYKSVITDKHPHSISDAEPIYLSVQSWLKRSQKYFRQENDVVEYVTYAILMMESYKLMACFHVGKLKQCQMIKRGVDLLEGLLGRLDNELHMALLQVAWNDLGAVYSILFNLEIEMMHADSTQSKRATVKKITDLFIKSTSYYNNLIANSQKVADRSLILAHFYCGQMSSKMVAVNPDKCIEYKKAALQHFQHMQRLMMSCNDELTKQRLQVKYDQCQQMMLSLSFELNSNLGT